TDSAQNLINPGAVFLRTVQDEIQFRHVALAQTFQDLVADKTLSRIDGFQRLRALMLVAFHVQVDAGAFAVRRQGNLGYTAQRDPRVAQFTLKYGANLLFQRLAYPFPVMLSATMLRHFTDKGKLLRISDRARKR